MPVFLFSSSPIFVFWVRCRKKVPFCCLFSLFSGHLFFPGKFTFLFWGLKYFSIKCGEPPQNQQILITRFALSAQMSPIPDSRSKYVPFRNICSWIFPALESFLLSMRLEIAIPSEISKLFDWIYVNLFVLLHVSFSFPVLRFFFLPYNELLSYIVILGYYYWRDFEDEESIISYDLGLEKQLTYSCLLMLI